MKDMAIYFNNNQATVINIRSHSFLNEYLYQLELYDREILFVPVQKTLLINSSKSNVQNIIQLLLGKKALIDVLNPKEKFQYEKNSRCRV